MIQSKYLGKRYGKYLEWEVIGVYLAANYEKSTKHNAYRYELARRTSDNKCDKIITVSGPTMKKIDLGRKIDEIVATKRMRNSNKTVNNVLYRY